ncbi:YggT family protein [Noviherbaspirillum cavernae]|uniref:YggT family protein n=1 Tax=Noviherbaspirillum cavernae TaxID=2320862 RepID=A0A418WY96_9BURK|nr:YggT family protein [Noviherbaspirillum cavernae]RJG05093.1 YggT family protein [Noviherbaspirillum cavernae]
MLQSIFTLIVDTIAGVLGGALLLRFWMQVVRVRPPMALGQFTFQLTDWLVRPMRRLLPGVGGYDWASLVGAVLVITLSIAIDLFVMSRFSPEFLVLLSVLRFFEWVFYGLMGLIIIEAIFSWVNPHAPLAPFIRALNDPLMRPLRRIVPLIGNIDLSPLVALVLLQIGLRVITYGITSLA